mmetsp:Transcript_24236/g.62553  ORF Transcript_24236/g.62553 Transcript_24236/m.62553 type:complete len:83 (+) Transcript_24236:121-369(+)
MGNHAAGAGCSIAACDPAWLHAPVMAAVLRGGVPSSRVMCGSRVRQQQQQLQQHLQQHWQQAAPLGRAWHVMCDTGGNGNSS